MSAFVEIGQIWIGGASNGAGLFNGQNMQNDWDSHAPHISAGGVLMGGACVFQSWLTGLWMWTLVGQPLVDQDWKMNGAQMWIGP
ncbi:MAG: hypothetical protein IRZ33_08740 [Alicyclobacillaceae bacterium]|nr:hypothetical protein [Alicyclobacillaceae bacterium]